METGSYCILDPQIIVKSFYQLFTFSQIFLGYHSLPETFRLAKFQIYFENLRTLNNVFATGGLIVYLVCHFQVSLIHNCKPSSEPYRGSRSNYFFTLLLLLTFLLCSVAVGWGITRYVLNTVFNTYYQSQCTQLYSLLWNNSLMLSVLTCINILLTILTNSMYSIMAYLFLK